ncbi:MAG TPA: hypothetical protein VF713_07025, partial [Thermoanaerobaculia bacterium]
GMMFLLSIAFECCGLTGGVTENHVSLPPAVQKYRWQCFAVLLREGVEATKYEKSSAHHRLTPHQFIERAADGHRRNANGQNW